MKKFSLFVLCISFFGNIFCQTSRLNSPRIASITYDPGDLDMVSMGFIYEYDDYGRCIREEKYDNEGYSGYIETFEYIDNSTVISIKTLEDTTQIIKSIYTLDSGGKAISVSQTMNDQTFSDRYVYNKDGFGFLLSSFGLTNATDEQLKEVNFNIDSILITEKGNIIKVLNNTYTYLDKKNTIGIKNQGLDFFGNENKNLCDIETIQTNEGFIDTKNIYYFDSKGRVVEQINQDVVIRYTYTD